MGKRIGMRRTVIVITIIVRLSLTFVVLFYPTVVLWVKYPSVDVIGTVDYTGLPEPDLAPIHGFLFMFIPDESERSKLSLDSRFDLVMLWPSNLDPRLDDKIVRIRGIFIDDYSTYRRETFQGRGLSGGPSGPVILVSNIEPLR